MSVDFNLTRVRLKPVLDALEGAAADFNLTRVRLKPHGVPHNNETNAELQPHESSSETSPRLPSSVSSIYFNLTRVRLKPTAIAAAELDGTTSTSREFV